MIPFGKAKVVKEGRDLTVVTYGAVVHRALVAAKELEERDGVRAEVIDLRSLSPVDWDAIARSVQKTDRKSTRLNSSHSQISYAVFCLKKKKKKQCAMQ